MRKKFKKIRRKLLLIVCTAVLVLFSVQIWNYFSPNEAEAAVLYWKFDEAYGSTTNDTSGNSNSGTITNATWQTSDLCRTDKCLYFDGSGDYVSRADDADLDFADTDDFTLTGWFRHPAISTNPDYLITKHESGTAGGYKVYMDSDGDIVFGVDDDGTWDTTDIVGDTLSLNLDDNRWHHFAAVKDGTTGIYLYIDGVLVASDESLTETGTLANAASFYVGIDADGTSNGWQGFIDEVKVHNEVRTASQIKADFSKGAPESGTAESFGGEDESWLSDGLIAYWKMDESAADSCGSTNDNCDSSGNGHNGDWTSDATTGAGKFGQALSLDGTDGYLDVFSAGNDVTEFSGGSAYTVSAWIYPAFTQSDASTYYVFQISDTITLRFNPSQDDFTLSSNLSGTNILLHTSGLTWSANTWHHIAVTYDGDRAVIYWDGALAATQEDASGTLNTTTTTTIGSDSIDEWSGKLDEVRMYTRAFSPKEIEDLYNWAPEPVGYWNLDENTGTSTANDISTNDKSATITNMEEQDWVPGKYGSALTFDGSDEFLTRADDADFDFPAANSFTVEAWVKHDTQSSGQDFIISKFASAGYKLYMESDGDLTFGIDDDGTSFPEDSATTTAADFDDNEWHHVAGVKDGTNSIKIYVDGELKATDSSLSATGTLENTDPLYIGIDEDGTSNAWLGGIDDVRIYNYARSQGQIVQDINAGHPAPGSPVGSPIAYWKMDEGQGSTVNDSAGVTSETLSFGTSPTWVTDGKFDHALDFERDNSQYIANGATFSTQPNATDMKDTYIDGGAQANNNYANVAQINTDQDDKRVLLEFDTSTIPAGSTCTSATLSLYVALQQAGSQSYGIHSLASGVAGWTEGGGFGSAGGGGATWNCARDDNNDGTCDISWTTAGAGSSGNDYEADASPPTITMNNEVAGTEITADLDTGANLNCSRIEGWFGESNTNYGLIIGATGSTTQRFWHSSDNGTDSLNPKLTINYLADVSALALTDDVTLDAFGVA